MDELLNELIFLFQRLDWLSILDLVLVTAVLFGILMLLRDTQAMVLLRGVLLLVVALAILTSLVNLQAFSWLITNALPALLLAVPVIFAPEIRRGLERLGRAGPNPLAFPARRSNDELVRQMIRTTVTTCARLSARQHGALIVLQREDNLREYMQTGILLNARASTELLLQIFYPNTPLHDGAAILVDDKGDCGFVCDAAFGKRGKPLQTAAWDCATGQRWVFQKSVMPSLWWYRKKPVPFLLHRAAE